MMIEKPLVLHPVKGMTFKSNKKENPKRAQRNKRLRERVIGRVMPMNNHFNGLNQLEIKIKAGVGFPYECWRIPFNRLVSIPRYLQMHIVSNMKLHIFQSRNDVPEGEFSDTPRAVAVESRAAFVEAAG